MSTELTLLFGVVAAMLGYSYQKSLERRLGLYNARRDVYSQYLRAWYDVVHSDQLATGTLPADLKREYSHAKSLLAMYGSDRVIRSFNALNRFILANDFLQAEYDKPAFLALLGTFLIQLRRDCGNSRLTYQELLGLTYIKVSELAAAGIDQWW